MKKTKAHIGNIGLEFELIALKQNGSAIKRKDIVSIWNKLLDRGWKPKIDPYNGELLGVKKKTPYGPIIMDNDGGAPLLEVAWPPYPDMQTTERWIKKVVREILVCFGDTYRLIGHGSAPFTKPGSVALTPKSYYPILLNIVDDPRAMDPFYFVGASQINIGADPKTVLRAHTVFSALVGPLVALSANSSIINGQVQPEREYRIRAYDLLQPHLTKGYHNFVGIPAKPFDSWKTFFRTILARPGHLLLTEGKMMEISDERSLLQLLKSKQPVQLKEIQYKGEKKRRIHEKILDIQDLALQQSLSWLDNRIKFRFSPTLTTDIFLKALSLPASKCDTLLGQYLENTYIEIRPIALQQPTELLIMPAFCLGIMENLDAAEAFIQKYPMSFWKTYRVEAYRHGLRASIGKVDIEELLHSLYTISEKGLKKRKKDELSFITPLLDRIETRTTPADRVEIWFKEQPRHTFLDNLSFTKIKI